MGANELGATGPPPDMHRRALIFDSLREISRLKKTRRDWGGSQPGSTRGTYIFTCGAGYHGQLGRRFGRGEKKYNACPRMVELKVHTYTRVCVRHTFMA